MTHSAEPNRSREDPVARGHASSLPAGHTTIRDVVVELYTDPDHPRTIAEISDLRGIGRETVREHLIRAGVPRRPRKARGTRETAAMARAAQLYQAGATLWEIAHELGKTATTIRAWLIEAGVRRRRPGTAVDPDSLAETKYLYAIGMTIDEVAAAQRLHPSTVRQRLVDARVPRRPRGRCVQPGSDQAEIERRHAAAADRELETLCESLERGEHARSLLDTPSDADGTAAAWDLDALRAALEHGEHRRSLFQGSRDSRYCCDSN